MKRSSIKFSNFVMYNVYVCMYVCMYVYIYTYTHTHYVQFSNEEPYLFLRSTHLCFPQRDRNQQIHTKLTDRSRKIAGSFSRVRQKEIRNKERMQGKEVEEGGRGEGKRWRSASDAASVCLNIRH